MKRIFKNTKASAAIEFAMLLLPFLIFITVLVEILLLIYQSVAIEYINSMSAQYASTFSYKENYKQKYNEYVKSRQGDIAFFLDSSDYDLNLVYCRSLEELYDDSCQGSNDENKIIIYELTYNTKPIFLYNWLERSKVIKSKVAYYSERNIYLNKVK